MARTKKTKSSVSRLKKKLIKASAKVKKTLPRKSTGVKKIPQKSPQKLSDTRVLGFKSLQGPRLLKKHLSLPPDIAKSVLIGRQQIRDVLSGKDRRLMVIVGPCSIHETTGAYEYASRLAELQTKVSDQLLIVMRVYFEKPRTTVGWKGLINDPHLDESYDVEFGLRKAREVLTQINRLGLFCATEFLDPIVPQYTADLVAWAAIGARTTESQTHREMASGLSMPVGFKNATEGGLQIAIDAMASARHGHAFLGIDQEGRTAIVRTAGNPDVHIVLRGGNKPNYSAADIAYAKVLCGTKGEERPLLVDCSHGNSGKDYRKQPAVMAEVVKQYIAGQSAILGVMLESHLVEGNQKLTKDLVYGQSVTDGCISWDTTKLLLLETHAQLRERLDG